MSKFKSRKFWLTVGAVVLVIANEGLSLGIPRTLTGRLSCPLWRTYAGKATWMQTDKKSRGHCPGLILPLPTPSLTLR
jgi:hypothetical protein